MTSEEAKEWVEKIWASLPKYCRTPAGAMTDEQKADFDFWCERRGEMFSRAAAEAEEELKEFCAKHGIEYAQIKVAK